VDAARWSVTCLGGLPVLAVVVAIVTITIFASELTSNTVQVALMLPLLAAAAPGLGVPPALLLIPCTLAASLAFMMPVGMSENAIVFGTGLVKIPQIIRAGVMLNLSGIVVVTAFAYLVMGPQLAGRREWRHRGAAYRRCARGTMLESARVPRPLGRDAARGRRAPQSPERSRGAAR
jgi:Na+/H+ antiporter NhaD/arsenite permease-like protein